MKTPIDHEKLIEYLTAAYHRGATDSQIGEALSGVEGEAIFGKRITWPDLMGLLRELLADVPTSFVLVNMADNVENWYPIIGYEPHVYDDMKDALDYFGGYEPENFKRWRLFRLCGVDPARVDATLKEIEVERAV